MCSNRASLDHSLYLITATEQGACHATFAETLPLVGFGVVTPQKLITDRPEVVRGFVKASQKGWDYLVKSPHEAIAEAVGVIKRNDEDTRDADGIAEAANKMIPGFMLSRSTEGKPVGWSNPDDWRQMIAVLQQVETIVGETEGAMDLLVGGHHQRLGGGDGAARTAVGRRRSRQMSTVREHEICSAPCPAQRANEPP